MAHIFRQASISEGSPRLLTDCAAQGLADEFAIGVSEPSVSTADVDASIERRIEEGIAAGIASLIDGAQEKARKEGFEKGFGEGYDEGFESGHQAGEAVLQAAIVRFQEMTIKLADAAKAQVNEASTLALEISYAAIARVLGERFADVDTVKHQVQQLCASVERSTLISIHVSPADAGALRANALEKSAVFDGLPGVTLVADPDVGLGGCLVKTSRETIDARLETQLTLLDQVITATRDNLRVRDDE